MSTLPNTFSLLIMLLLCVFIYIMIFFCIKSKINHGGILQLYRHLFCSLPFLSFTNPHSKKTLLLSIDKSLYQFTLPTNQLNETNYRISLYYSAVDYKHYLVSAIYVTVNFLPYLVKVNKHIRHARTSHQINKHTS